MLRRRENTEYQSKRSEGFTWGYVITHVFYRRATAFDTTLLKGSAFEPLKDEKVLEDFNIFHGVMTWMNGDIDIAPETMYADSYPYTAQSVSIAVG